MAQEADPPNPFQMLQILYKSFINLNILEPQAPRGSGRTFAKPFANASNPLQTLYKTEHFGGSGASRLRMRIRQILFKCFKSFTNPFKRTHFGASGGSWLRRPDLPDPFQRLQILHKCYTKQCILEPLAPHGSGCRICQIL